MVQSSILNISMILMEYNWKAINNKAVQLMGWAALLLIDESSGGDKWKIIVHSWMNEAFDKLNKANY